MPISANRCLKLTLFSWQYVTIAATSSFVIIASRSFDAKVLPSFYLYEVSFIGGLRLIFPSLCAQLVGCALPLPPLQNHRFQAAVGVGHGVEVAFDVAEGFVGASASALAHFTDDLMAPGSRALIF